MKLNYYIDVIKREEGLFWVVVINSKITGGLKNNKTKNKKF